MNDDDVRDVIDAVQSFPFPPGVRRTLASDMEATAVHVLMMSSERFYVLSIRSAYGESTAARVHEELAEAVESLCPPCGGFVINSARMGSDM